MTTPRKTINIVQSVRASSPRRADAERKLAQYGLGMLLALREERMTIEQARKDLFNMDSYRSIRRFHYSRHLGEFVLWGMELEDVVALAPKGLAESYAKMDRLLRLVLAASQRATARRAVRVGAAPATLR